MKISKNGNFKNKNFSFSAKEEDARRKKIANEYKEYTGVSKIAEEDFDDVALNKLSRRYARSVEDLKKDLLAAEANGQTLEEAAIDQAKQDLDNPDVVSNDGQIEQALNWAYEYNSEQIDAETYNFENLLLIGEAGTGKTSRVKNWAKEKGVNLFIVRAAGMDDTDLGGALSIDKSGETVKRLASTEFDQLEKPNSVLFLDEYNRAPKSVRTNLLELVNSHQVPDPRVDGGQRFLPNFLFTVAAINPATANYDTDIMDMAEKTRFRNINIQNDPKNTLTHLQKQLDHMKEVAKTPERAQRAKGRKALAEALINGGLQFDSQAEIDKMLEEYGPEELALNARTFTNLIMGCDGTKADLLKKWDEYTNRHKKADAKRILGNYVDVTDKANAALGIDDGSAPESPFSTKKELADELLDMIDGL